jgi:rod shape-determining protein MreC
LKAKKGILAALVIFGAFLLWVAIGRQTAAEAVYPVENGANWLVRHVFHPMGAALARPRLAAENRRLMDEIARLKMQLADHAELAAENDRLRVALDFDRRNPGTWIAAPVLSRGGTLGAGDMLRIGKGSAAGIRKGAAVAVPEGLVGQVADVSRHTAEIRLVTDPAVKVACEVMTEEPDGPAAFGILSGGRLVHLQRDLVLPEHAKVVTSGLGEIYPRGITVGTLAQGAHVDETQLEQVGEIVPAVDFSSLETVFIYREE